MFAASVVLTGFLGMTGWVLDRAFYDSAEAALKERLQGNIYALIAGSDVNTKGVMKFPESLAEPRFANPGSGLYAQIMSHDGKQVWRSASSVGLQIPYLTKLPRGISKFDVATTPTGMRVFTFNMGLAWEVRRKEVGFTFGVAESMDAFNSQLRSFRKSLWSGLGGATLLLLLVQSVILRWGLRPLRRVAEDLRAIEQGKATHLEGRYPSELQGMTRNLNALLRSEREHLDRYRNTLSDLAHSLKTPLAVLQGEVDAPRSPEQLRETLAEQVARMRQLVDYQLQKAATVGRTTLTAPVSVADIIERLVSSLVKVYAEKNVACKVAIHHDVVFAGDKSDLMELAGNLLDNAFKYCRAQVQVSARQERAKDGRAVMHLTVEDDGPGIAEEKQRAVLARGVRADERAPGQGIGLAVVRDIVELYRGKLVLGRSERLRGARVTVSV